MANTALESACRHLWYLAPQTVVFCLIDAGMSAENKEDLAKALHSTERKTIQLGKPKFLKIS